ncbi:hypothetical protein B0181_09420 [Moraxella caviae]|uniref:ATP-dependent Clp protease adapter protein ClpS n=1 Tax=Moraxella caviae TaxID=34060 RepID=A0A1S9ZWT6_9GAMM|nr:hypothetical protein B0181_09420 [Moraxella caviae]
MQHTQARLDDETETDVALDVADEVALDEPAKYAVILHNDDYTTMDFVVAVLMQVFGHDLDKAVALMYQVHEQGSAVAAVYVKEIAETKAAQVVQLAENAQYPLLATIEPAL